MTHCWAARCVPRSRLGRGSQRVWRLAVAPCVALHQETLSRPVLEPADQLANRGESQGRQTQRRAGAAIAARAPAIDDDGAVTVRAQLVCPGGELCTGDVQRARDVTLPPCLSGADVEDERGGAPARSAARSAGSVSKRSLAEKKSVELSGGVIDPVNPARAIKER